MKNNSPIQTPRRHQRQARGDDERLDLRPLDEALLPQTPGRRHSTASRTPCSRSTRAARTPSCSTTRRWRSIAAADPIVEDDRRPVPRAAVRHRHQAGQRRAEALGRLAAQPHEAEGPVPADHPEQHRAAVRAGVLEEHPAAEQTLHVPRRRACRASTRCARSADEAPDEEAAAPARPPPCCASDAARHLRPLGVRVRELARAPRRRSSTRSRSPRSRSPARS